MSTPPVRRPVILVSLLAACGAFVAWLALSSGDGAESGVDVVQDGERGVVRDGAEDWSTGLSELGAQNAADRVAPGVSSRGEGDRPPPASDPDAVTFLSGEVVLVDADGVVARHSEVCLRVSVFVEGGRPGELVETETEDGRFDVTFVEGDDGTFAHEAGSRDIGEGPFDGRVAIYGAALSPGLVRLALLRELQGGGLAPVDRLSFDLGTGPVRVFVRAPRAVTLEVFDAGTGEPVGPVRIRPTYREGVVSSGPPRQPPVEVVLPSVDGGALMVSAEGYAPARVAIDEDLRGVVRVPMNRGGSIHARFLLDEADAESGGGRPVHVTLRRAGEAPSGGTNTVMGRNRWTWRRNGLAPGTYFVTASDGFGVGRDGRATEVTRAVELPAGEDVSLVIDLTGAAAEPRSPIVLDVVAPDGGELPAVLDVELSRTQPEGGSRPITAPFAPGARRGEVRLGEWPAGRYRAVLTGGRATVDLEHAAGASPTRIAVDLGDWVPWQVRLVEEGTGRPADNGSMKVQLPGSSTPLPVRPDDDGVFRFHAPVHTRACSVLLHVDPRFVTCPLPPYASGVLDVAVPVLGEAEPAGLQGFLGR